MSLGLFGDFLRNLRLLCGFSFLMIAAGATRFALVLTLGPIALFPGILRTETVAHALDHFGVAFSLVLSLTIAIKAIVVAITTPALLLFLAGAIVRKHAEIMVGELEVIFRIDTITLRLRVTCRSEEHTSELQSLLRTSYAVFCLK